MSNTTGALSAFGIHGQHLGMYNTSGVTIVLQTSNAASHGGIAMIGAAELGHRLDKAYVDANAAGRDEHIATYAVCWRMAPYPTVSALSRLLVVAAHAVRNQHQMLESPSQVDDCRHLAAAGMGNGRCTADSHCNHTHRQRPWESGR